MRNLAVGDYVVYPSQGVAEVIALDKQHVAGHTVAFVRMSVLDTGARLLVPLEKLGRVGLRPIVAPDVADRVLRVFDEPAPGFGGHSWIQISRRYEAALAGGDLDEVAEVLRDLYAMKMSGDLSFGQLRLLERSRRMILHELSIALRYEPARVEALIRERMHRAQPRLAGAS